MRILLWNKFTIASTWILVGIIGQIVITFPDIYLRSNGTARHGAVAPNTLGGGWVGRFSPWGRYVPKWGTPGKTFAGGFPPASTLRANSGACHWVVAPDNFCGSGVVVIVRPGRSYGPREGTP